MTRGVWDIGTDIGGTFTDIVAVRSGGSETRIAKVPSRPHAPVAAMLEAIDAVGVPRADVRRFVHGTTRITNALVEERLPRVALVATAGFEDVLEIGRYRRHDLYRLDIPPKARPLVPSVRCFGLRERMDHTGNPIEPLTDVEIDRLIEWLHANDVQSVAVCLMHAYANGAHERRVAERLAGLFPHVCLSHEINTEAREYERASSTAFNAAAMPIAVEYLSELEKALPLGQGLQVFHSAGGMISIDAVKRRPIAMAMSGPAAGVTASAQLARTLGRSHILTFDMGGTTTDVCLIVDGVAEMIDTRMLGGRPLRQPMLAVHSVGAGGGSIVRLGPGGLTVGPQSAGSEPGPACYGRGGREATITDANAILGYLDPDARLGSTIALDLSAAEAALAPIAETLGLSVADAALGIVRVANAAMARALSRVTVERGIDGRACTLLAFGGSGPMHATGLAEIYGLGEIIVPAASSAFSALGCLTAEFSSLEQRTVRQPLSAAALPVLSERIAELERAALSPLLANGIDRASIVLEHVALMRYAAQSDALPLPLKMPLDIRVVEVNFHRRHRELFGYATSEPCVIEALRVKAREASAAPVIHTPVDRQTRTSRSRKCVFAGVGGVMTPVVHRAAIAGAISGPAIIEDAWSTIVVPPQWSARPDDLGNLVLTRSDR